MRERLELAVSQYEQGEELRDAAGARQPVQYDPPVLRPHGLRHRRRLGRRRRTHDARARGARELRAVARRRHASRPRRRPPPGARRARSRPRRGAASPTTSRSSARSPAALRRRRQRRPSARTLDRAADDATAAYAEHRDVAARRVRAGGDRARRGRRRPLRAAGPHRSAAWSSISPRPTSGAGRSCTASSTRCARSASASCPARGCPRSSSYLETDEHRAIEGVDEFQRVAAGRSSTASIAELNGTHFDSPSRSGGARR